MDHEKDEKKTESGKSMDDEKHERSDEDQKKLDKEVSNLKSQIAELKSQIANNPVLQPDPVPPGEKQKSKSNEDLEKEVSALRAKIAEKEDEEKREMANELMDIMIKDEIAGEDEKERETASLVKMEKSALADRLSLAKRFHSALSAKSETALQRSTSSRKISYASTKRSDGVRYDSIMEMMP